MYSILVSMASSSSSSSGIHIKSGPIDGDVLWLQPKHVSEHVWNGESDTKLHIRRVVPIYQGQEEIPEEIIPLLRQSGFYWIMKMGFIGGVLFVDKSSSKVSLRYLQFLRDFEQCSTYAWRPAVLAYLYREMCSATGYKIKSIGSMCILIQMWAWERCTTLAPKRTPPIMENKPLGHRWLRRGNQHIGNDDLIVFRRKLDIMKRLEFLREPYPATVMSMLPPICLVGSVAWCAVVPLICFHVVEWHQPNRWNNRAEFRVDVYPRQEGLLSFNSDYMVWYRRKTKMFVDPNNANTATLGEVAETLQYMVSLQGRNTWTVDDLVSYVEKLAIISQEQERITEHVAHGPASERRFPPQQFHMHQSSVETRGFDKRREIVQAEDFSQQMDQRGHGMYYTPPTFSQYPSQMYQYPFEGHDTDMSTNEHSFGGVAETHPNFSWPTMTPSQQHDAPMATPNAPLGPQWDVPGAIPDISDLLGVDLRHEFSTEAEQQG
ncbi:Serine/threonine-protein phosphatase 7 long form [Glycine soja]